MRSAYARVKPFSGSEKSSSSSVWDTTNKVLGVNTVLGTAGLTSASITLPSLGGGVVGGAATAAMGVATAASLVTGVGVIVAGGVAGVQYVRKQSQRRRRKAKKKGMKSEDIEEEKAAGAEVGNTEELQQELESDIDQFSGEDDDTTTEEGEDGDDEDEGETKEAEASKSSET